MNKMKTIRFVGGPLHGESRSVEDSRSKYLISEAAALAVGAELRGEEADPTPDDERLEYTRRHDGRYYLEVDQPAEVKPFPEGFEAKWFDVGEHMLLVEVHAPPSAYGHAFGEVRVARDFVLDAVATEDGLFIFKDALAIIELRERDLIRSFLADTLDDLAVSVSDGTELAKGQGNRRLIAAVLRDYADASFGG